MATGGSLRPAEGARDSSVAESGASGWAGEDQESEIGSLFCGEREEERVFVFQDLFWEVLESGESDSDLLSRVTFVFLYGTHKKINSTMNVRAQRLTSQHQHALFCIGMCVLPWYWMGFGCERIVINSEICPYSPSLLEFWQSLYSNVLLEFLHCNKSAEFPKLSLSDANLTSLPVPTPLKMTEAKDESEGAVLVPIGGGKDSLVVWHLNSKRRRRLDLFYVTDETEEFSKDWRLQEISRLTERRFLVVSHSFDYDSIRRMSRSYLSPTGHPWAALCLFDAVLMALLKGHREVHMGNERSADEGNHISFAGIEINHQYDKSSQFLSMATRYVQSFLSPDIVVSSPLDTLWEIEVAEVFCSSSLTPFHSVFLSCNSPKAEYRGADGAVLKRWCNSCEKCVFVFLLMSAFLSPTAVTEIFGGNLFESPSLEPIFLSVLGLSEDGAKPFECIGTPEESLVALLLTLRQYRNRRRVEALSSPELTDANSEPDMLLRLCSRGGISKEDLDLDPSRTPKDFMTALGPKGRGRLGVK